jgi:hypothetical protein
MDSQMPQIAMPSSLSPSLCEVLWLNNGPRGEQPIIIGWHGAMGSGQLEEIERQWDDNPDLWEEQFTHGAGVYLFSVHWCEDQVEDCGGVPRVTDPGYWELSFVRYESFPAEE